MTSEEKMEKAAYHIMKGIMLGVSSGYLRWDEYKKVVNRVYISWRIAENKKETDD